MKRKIYDQLLKWKNDEHGESAVLIEGARRVDKFRRKYRMQSDMPIVLHTKDLKIEDDVMYLPLYMTSVL